MACFIKCIMRKIEGMVLNEGIRSLLRYDDMCQYMHRYSRLPRFKMVAVEPVGMLSPLVCYVASLQACVVKQHATAPVCRDLVDMERKHQVAAAAG